MLKTVTSTLLTAAALTGLVALPFIPPVETPDYIGELIVQIDEQEELMCMKKNIWFEARGEAIMGWKAVFDVTMNRVADPRWPDTICGVVYQGVEPNDGLDPQFSWTADEPENTDYQQTDLFYQIDQNVQLWSVVGTRTTDANHYARTEISRVWMASMVNRGTIGAHTFYYAK